MMTPEHKAILDPFTVAFRPIRILSSAPRAGWIEQEEGSLDRARHAYDDGVVELCQGRDENRVYLYAIPRKRPLPGRSPHAQICRLQTESAS